MVIYGGAKGTDLSLSLAALGVVLIVIALFHRRMKRFRLRLGRFEVSGEVVADLGGEDDAADDDATEPSEPADDARPDPPRQ
jgi:hypothetical protein